MKTPRAIGLAAALVAAVLVPAAAISQGKKGAEVSEAARKSGMEKAPALAQAIGLPCQVSDARLVGEDKKSKTAYYEIACATGGMGYVIQAPGEGTPSAFTCVEANTPPEGAKEAALPCLLPANADPKQALVPMLAKAGVQCVPEQVRGIGQTKTQTYMEVACQRGVGYIVVASSPFDASKDIQAQNCLMYDDAATNIKCVFSDKAARLSVADQYATAANNGCVVKDRRFVGMSKDGANFYEASCQDGKGYIYKVDNAGQLAQTYECSKAQGILGGCELTDARQAQTEQAALYTRLAKAAGSNCDVEQYALFPSKPGEEVVELKCKDGTGAVGLFKAGSGGQVLNCAHALAAGYKCGLSDAKSGYGALTADLHKFNLKSCEVSNSRLAAKTQKGTVLIEVACADGYKGYMIEYQTQPKVTALGATGCAFAGNCQLPGNT